MSTAPVAEATTIDWPTVLAVAAVGATGAAWWHNRNRQDTSPEKRRRWKRAVAIGAVLAGAAAATFHAVYELSLQAQLPGWVALTMPLLLDGAALATAQSWADHRLPAWTRYYAGGIVVLLALLSIAANVAFVARWGGTEFVRLALAVVPPLTLVLVGTLMHRVHQDELVLADADQQHFTATRRLAAADRAMGLAEQREAHGRDVIARWESRFADWRADARAELAETRELVAEQARTQEKAAVDADAAREHELAEAEAHHQLLMELAAAGEAHQRDSEASARLAEKAVQRQRAANAEQGRLTDTRRPAAPTRQRRSTGGRQPQQSVADLLTAARPILAKRQLGRTALATELDCTNDRARQVLDAWRKEQTTTSSGSGEA